MTRLPLRTLLLVFTKLGATSFGGPLAHIALIDHGILRCVRPVILAITVDQITPGPLYSMASFIGFLLQGWSGTGLATLGIFAPAFLMIACSRYLLPRLERFAALPHLLLGVNAAAMGLMALVCYDLMRGSLQELEPGLGGSGFCAAGKDPHGCRALDPIGSCGRIAGLRDIRNDEHA